MDTADGELMIEPDGRNATNQPRSVDAPAVTDELSVRQTDLKAGFGATRLEGFHLASRERSLACFGLSAVPFWLLGLFLGIIQKVGFFCTMRRSAELVGKAWHLT